MSAIPPPVLPEYPSQPAPQPQPQKSSRGKGVLLIFLGVSLFINLILFLWVISADASHPHSAQRRSPFRERFLTGTRDSENKIAVVRVEGIIFSETGGHMGYDGMVGDVREQLRLATEDDNVKAILVKIDSPGGEVLASDQLYKEIKKARNKKKVVCCMGSVAASGGYYAAMGCNWVIADEMTITGSIGVIMKNLNYKELFDKIGLKSMVYKSGKFKDILNGGREQTPEEVEIIQAMVMETYEKFLKVVSEERKLPAEELRNGLADGRVFSGKQALTAKLVDENGDFQAAIEKAKALGGVVAARVVDYEVPFSWGNLWGVFSESRASTKVELHLEPQAIPLETGKLYFLSHHLF